MNEVGVEGQKAYMRSSYAKYWSVARQKKYRDLEYDKECIFLIDACLKSEKSKLLEVAVGAGIPFADNFARCQHEVHGVDIAPLLVEQCLKNNSSIHAQVGDAESLSYEDAEFDLVYCLHSLWFIPDYVKAIEEMVRVTRVGGSIVFDLQNFYCEEIRRSYQRSQNELRGLGKCYRYFKNIIKIVTRKGTPNWSAMLYENPNDVELVYELFRRLDLRAWTVYKFRESMVEGVGNARFEDSPRLVLVVSK